MVNHVHPYRRAFTLIELLVVMVIIGILMGIILAVVPLVRDALRRSRAEATMGTIASGLEATAMERGGAVSPGLHPLAGSLSKDFVRGVSGAGVVMGTAVSPPPVGSIAPFVADMNSVLAAFKPLVLLDTDSWRGNNTGSGCICPKLFGLPRWKLSVVGSSDGLLKYRRLPALNMGNDTNHDGFLDPPYTAAKYPDSLYLTNLVNPDGSATDPPSKLDDLEDSSRKLFDFSFSKDSSRAELANFGAIVSDTTGPLICANRVRSWEATDTRGLAGKVQAADGSWQSYHLRGTGIYDAWDNEILYYIKPGGGFGLESAGKDGVFVWKPGNDKVFQTNSYDDPRLASPSGDDKRGDLDNLVQGSR